MTDINTGPAAFFFRIAFISAVRIFRQTRRRSNSASIFAGRFFLDIPFFFLYIFCQEIGENPKNVSVFLKVAVNVKQRISLHFARRNKSKR